MKKTIRRILIVDDEFEFCKTIQRHLKREGFLTDYAVNGTAAYQKVQNSFTRKRPFDLVIIDIIMATSESVELSRKIMNTYASVSILFVTACSEFDMVKEIMRPAMDDHCKKPLSPQKMLGFIDNIDQKRRSLFGKNEYQGDCT